ncbi:pyridoxamine 5'-phosphate oxidase family protein [Desulfoscipio gibsoniae]|uniref:Pyridoxamine 5'-phosphate oxidase N-terminal domain-containing protein n=1 Tax=Desulfoscipio gibsoniae DSM 7213 TaxID=767817 RepID=R4KKS6_9FIRM|nr:pyridoxamine 5'-phosphate oxidase family protein [Desulfoscipio gibsoniae]AGL03264.1 hypothetical protein Desgi_3984 [Desulfoscipio gibsoniae DSM 7213]
MEELKNQIIDFISRHSTLTLGTVSPEHRPQAADLFYVNDGLELFFLSKSEARHCVNIATNPLVAATIHDESREWRQIKGVQVEGRAFKVEETGRKARVMALYIKKFPFVQSFFAAPRLAKLMAEIKVYRILPETICYIDNSSGYFNRQTLKLPY